MTDEEGHDGNTGWLKTERLVVLIVEPGLPFCWPESLLTWCFSNHPARPQTAL